MSIGVQSYPELYTMLIGWDLYGKMWELLTQTGIAYLPFIGMILRSIAQSYITSGVQGAAQSLRDMEVKIISTLFIIMLGVSPFIPLSTHTISFSPICGKDNDTYHPGSTGTTYDKAFMLPSNEVRVPIWWYGVMTVSSGMTNAASHHLGCLPNLRKMVTTVNMTGISDPAVKEELLDFQNMCYSPAKTQWLSENKSDADNASNLEKVKRSIKKYGEEDTEWLGSHAFSDTYYRSLKSSRPVIGFHYQSTQDLNAESNKTNPPEYGSPSCYEWWNDATHGLKKRVYDALPSGFKYEFRDVLKSEKHQDSAIRRIIMHTPSYENANNTVSNLGLAHAATALGILYHQMTEYPKIYAAAQSAPIIQSLLLLMIYVFLPFGLVFSGYKPSAFVIGASVIFSLIFWSFIWHLVSWVDTALMKALYSDWFEKQSPQATLVDMIIGSLVIAAPVFWFAFMGVLGVTVGNLIDGSFSSMGRIGDKAAESGANMAKNAASAATKAVL